MNRAILLFILLITSVATSQQSTINTIGGGGPNHLPATDSNLAAPAAVAFDATGNMYIADMGQNRIFRVDASGLLTVFAGNGIAGNSGDGGAAIDAELYDPSAVAFDAAGNVYIADLGNHIVRAVSADGTIKRVAGNYLPSFNGDGIPATKANLTRATDLAIDAAGNIYIADDGAQRVRKVTRDGMITTAAGTGVCGYNGDNIPATQANLCNPAGIALDVGGNLYIAERGGNRIRRVSPAGIITTSAGTGVAGYNGDGIGAATAYLNAPRRIAVDADGNLFISDSGNSRVRQVLTDGTIITVAGGNGAGYNGDAIAATSALLSSPQGLGFDDSGAIHVADLNNYRIRKIAGGMITTVAGNGWQYFSGEGVPATDAALGYINSVAYDLAGNLFLADSENNRVRKIDVNGTITTVAGTGLSGYNGDGIAATTATLTQVSVALDGAGNLYVADTDLLRAAAGRVRKIDEAGTITTVAGTGVSGYNGDDITATTANIIPVSVALDGAGNLYISDGNRIRKVDPAGVISTFASGSTQMPINPGQLALNETINRLYLADRAQHVIRTFDLPTGYSDYVIGTGSWQFNGDILFDLANIDPGFVVPIGPYDYNVYWAEYSRVRRIGLSGYVETIVGNGQTGFAGDGGLATAAMLYSPTAIALGPCRVLFIADNGNRRIRSVNGDCIPPTVTATVHALNVGAGAWNTSVTVDFAATDNVGGSGVREVRVVPTGAQRSPESDGSAFLVDTEGTTTLAYQAFDFNDNSSPKQFLTFNIDHTPPNPPNYTITPPPALSGWYTSDVSVTFSSAGDAGPVQSGVAYCSSPVTLTEDTSWTQVYGHCFDNAGNESQSPFIVVALDKTPPIVQVTGVADGTSYIIGTSVTPGCTTSDYTSFVASDASLTINGGTAGGLGQYTATCAGGSDRAGNVAPPVRAMYKVIYGFRGFLVPVDNPPIINVAKAGQAIPVKWQLFDASNSLIANLDLPYTSAHITSWPVACTAGVLDAIGDTNTYDNTLLRYDAAAGQYIFNWKTYASWTGTCRYLQIGLPDGTTHGAQFRFK